MSLSLLGSWVWSRFPWKDATYDLCVAVYAHAYMPVDTPYMYMMPLSRRLCVSLPVLMCCFVCFRTMSCLKVSCLSLISVIMYAVMCFLLDIVCCRCCFDCLSPQAFVRSLTRSFLRSCAHSCNYSFVFGFVNVFACKNSFLHSAAHSLRGFLFA